MIMVRYKDWTERNSKENLLKVQKTGKLQLKSTLNITKKPGGYQEMRGSSRLLYSTEEEVEKHCFIISNKHRGSV